MITGDHPRTAGAIAAELGIATDGLAVTGAEIEAMPDTVLDRTIRKVSVFARVTAEQKLRIVEAFKRVGHIVAMTGDGVNDAPALRGAHRRRDGQGRHRRGPRGGRHGASPTTTSRRSSTRCARGAPSGATSRSSSSSCCPRTKAR